MTCQGIRKDGSKCKFRGKVERDGAWFCKVHLPIEDCSVCYEAIQERSAVKLPCSHVYHKKCLRKWIKNNHATCPYCRERIPDDVIDRLCPAPADTARTFLVEFTENAGDNRDELLRFVMGILNVHVLELITSAQVSTMEVLSRTEGEATNNPR
jgi:hypothetical protein